MLQFHCGGKGPHLPPRGHPVPLGDRTNRNARLLLAEYRWLPVVHRDRGQRRFVLIHPATGETAVTLRGCTMLDEPGAPARFELRTRPPTYA